MFINFEFILLEFTLEQVLVHFNVLENNRYNKMLFNELLV